MDQRGLEYDATSARQKRTRQKSARQKSTRQMLNSSKIATHQKIYNILKDSNNSSRQLNVRGVWGGLPPNRVLESIALDKVVRLG